MRTSGACSSCRSERPSARERSQPLSELRLGPKRPMDAPQRQRSRPPLTCVHVDIATATGTGFCRAARRSVRAEAGRPRSRCRDRDRICRAPRGAAGRRARSCRRRGHLAGHALEARAEAARRTSPTSSSFSAMRLAVAISRRGIRCRHGSDLGSFTSRSIEGLREWHRVLRHGGLIAFSTMPAGFPVAGRLFRECAGDLRSSARGSVRPTWVRWRLPKALAAAGFVDPETVTEPIEFSVRDIERAWESNLRSLAHKPLGDLPAESLLALQQRYQAVLAAEMRADPARLLKSPMLYAFARR